jgi:hypothetical protein
VGLTYLHMQALFGYCSFVTYEDPGGELVEVQVLASYTCLLHAFYTPPTRLVHASYTPFTRLLHATYTTLTRLLHASCELVEMRHVAYTEVSL